MPEILKDDKVLRRIYNLLYSSFGPRRWWPADTPFEVIIGAILTQNTAWTNVTRAINNLKENKLLTPKKLHEINKERLAMLIRPAGYFNIKSSRIKHFMNFLFSEYGGSLKRMFKEDTKKLREKLLSVKGIGPETADSILLYAGEKPVFVVDAYTKRLLSRHGLLNGGMDYDEIQAYFMAHLPEDARLYNEFHALIVQTGKEFCRPKPICPKCPLRDIVIHGILILLLTIILYCSKV